MYCVLCAIADFLGEIHPISYDYAINSEITKKMSIITIPVRGHLNQIKSTFLALATTNKPRRHDATTHPQKPTNSQHDSHSNFCFIIMYYASYFAIMHNKSCILFISTLTQQLPTRIPTFVITSNNSQLLFNACQKELLC